ncbi:MAG: helix-turn-helix domain-containing protein [Candidatus Thiodiazotropha sp. (ex Gloverina cf. vestifex)]|nr:helix-turn-helix domain-containing protein [Candidatus Thiodiazotropha sp. (ex Gloverina cf. vestifex)]
MKNKNNSDSNPAEGTIDGPGSQLRKARERQGLEQAEVAARLNLNHSIVQALEWDDYENLPSAVFVQGYLRNYARLVGVDEEAVIISYQELNPSTEQAPLPKNQPDEVAKELHSDHRLFRVVTWTVVLLLGILLFFWWQGRMDLPEPEPIPSTQMPETQSPGFEVPFSEPGTMDLTQPIAEPGDLPEAEEAPPLIETETAPSATEPEPVAEAIVTEAISDDTETLIATESSFSEPEAAPEVELVTTSEETTETVASSGLVVFEFTGSCWVEVRDATGRARIFGEKRGGVSRSLDGSMGPFSVVLGDINAVKVSVNGVAFDLKPYARGKVARFTLDPTRL